MYYPYPDYWMPFPEYPDDEEVIRCANCSRKISAWAAVCDYCGENYE